MAEYEEKRIFQKNLNNMIVQSGKTQKEIADAIKVSPQTFNTWVQGIAIPRMGKIQMLADYFHIKKSDLIEERTPDPAPAAARELVLTPHEEDLVLSYRNASDDTQIAVCAVLGIKRDLPLDLGESSTA